MERRTHYKKCEGPGLELLRTSAQESRHRVNSLFRLLAAALLLLLLPHSLQAQDPDDLVTTGNSTGVEAFGSYAGLRENVNLQNRNLNVVIPLFTLTGRNGLSFAVAANYNAITRQWEEEQRPDESIRCVYRPLANTGSDRVEIELAPFLTYEEGAQADPDGMVPANAPRHNRYVLREMDGTRHEFRNAVREEDLLDVPTVDGAERFRSTGSTHMSLQELPGTAPVKGSTDVEIFTPGGRRLFFDRASGAYQIESITDSNGNRITFQHSAGQVVSATDTLGREISRQITVVNGVLTRTEIFYLTSSGQQVEWALERNVPAAGQDTLTLPGGLKHVFHYGPTPVFSDPCGQGILLTNTRLTRIDYPSGGWVEYDWGVFPAANPTMSVLTAVRRCDQADGVCSASEEAVWTYDQPAGGPVMRTRPDGSRSEHEFGIVAGSGLREPHELTSRFYDADGTLLRTVENAWEEFNRDPKVVEVNETLHSISGADQVRRTETVYDRTGYVIQNGSGTFIEQASRGNVVTVRESDWGGGAAGPLLRRTENQYLSSSAYGHESSVHILNRVTRSQLFSGTGELAAQSDFFYDEYSSFNGFIRSLIGVSTIQRAPGYGTGTTLRGNLSRRVDWLDTGADPVTLFRYDTAGNIRQVRDPNENINTMSYTSATQFAYIATMTNALGHVQSFTYDYNSGLLRGLGSLAALTDSNGHTMSMIHDILGRTVRINYPDGGVEHRYFSDLQPSALHHETGQSVFPGGTQLPLRSK
ncbi:MAG TPA: hypothetical protein VLU25_12650, partial [Acidobacteriota bacterium]|nr:hypothetical protein [Acidobacteriota bacterium]